MKWLLTPYNLTPNLTTTTKKFNKALSSDCVTSEQTFRILKAQWQCSVNNLTCHVENASTVIIACCVLHNIFQSNNDGYIDDNGILEAVIRQKQNARRRRTNHTRAPVTAINTGETIKLYIMNKH